jgi:hypothetical protein
MTELRSRMIRDMTVRGFSPRTHEAYIQPVVGLARHHRRAPDQLSADEGPDGPRLSLPDAEAVVEPVRPGGARVPVLLPRDARA